MQALRRFIELLKPVLKDPTFPGPGEGERLQHLLVYVIRGSIQVVREAARDGLLNQASALSFQTLFSTIPVVVIGLTVLTQFISQQEVVEIADWLSQHMLPAQAHQVALAIRNIADAVDVNTLGLAGIAGLIIVAATLFWTLTHIVDNFWKVKQKPPLTYRALSAVVILLLLPTFAGLSVFFSQLLHRLPWSVDFFVPLLVNVGGLYLGYRYVPSLRVDPRAAIASAVLMGLVLELAKIGFSFYVAELSVTIRGLYGAIAFIPMSFFWVWVLWLIFLFGVKLTYTLQNLTELWLRDSPLPVGSLESQANGHLALMVAHRVYELEAANSALGITLPELSRQMGASPLAVAEVVERLEAEGVAEVTESGVIRPAQEAEAVQVTSVLGLYASMPVANREEGELLPVEALLEKLRAARDGIAGDVTMADLIE